LFRQVSGTRNLVEWRSTVGWPTPFLIEQARAADLIVISRKDIEAHEDERFGIDRADVLADAGRPLLVTPPQLDSLSAERVVIAWKNTREARRAVRDSLPLLERASEVTVTAIGAGEDDAGIDDVRAYLARHGIRAVTDRRGEGEADVAGQIFGLARERGADLIVAGGYGRSRMREWIFGGVTHDLLERTPVCCLMAH
jgi:nucleotide-binding universal stress UspA family protein